MNVISVGLQPGGKGFRRSGIPAAGFAFREDAPTGLIRTPNPKAENRHYQNHKKSCNAMNVIHATCFDVMQWMQAIRL